MLIVQKNRIKYVIFTVADFCIIYFLCYFSIGSKETALSIYTESPVILFLGKLVFSILFTTIIILFLISIFVSCIWLIIKGSKHCFYITTILLIFLSVVVLDSFVNESTTHIILSRIFLLSFSLCVGYLFYLSRHSIRKWFNSLQNILFKQIMLTFMMNFFIICIESLFILLYKLLKNGYV